MAAPNRVVVRAPNWIGDAVMALGGLRELRRIVGDGHLAVAARPWVAGIFEQARIADEIVVFERKSWRDAFTAASTLRAGHYDVAVLFQNAFEAALVARLGRARRVIGYPTDGRRALLTDVVPLSATSATEHQSRYYLRIAAGAERALFGSSDVDVDTPDVSLDPTASCRERGAVVLADAGVAGGRAVVALNPGATNSRAKQWPAERFAAVGDELAARLAARIVLIGSSGDADVAARVAGAMRGPEAPIVLAGRTSVTELIGVLSHATALVSNDTGPAHLGAALGIPTVTIFGPTEDFATHPIGPLAARVRKPVECSPCMLRDCPIDHRCMTGVEPADVLATLEKVTRDARAPRN